MLFVVLRIFHIVAGVFWAGSMMFLANFLSPAINDAGPAGGPVMMALMKRNVFTIVPIAAILTILSGGWMFWIDSEGMKGPWLHSHMSLFLSIGAVLALIAFFVGMLFVRPLQMKIFAMMGEIGPMPDGPDKQGRLAAVGAMRAKAFKGGKAVAHLLALCVLMMAIARYL